MIMLFETLGIILILQYPTLKYMIIKVLLYDDVKELRESLVLLINSTEGFEVVGAFDNCETAPDDIASLQPDVVLMDIDMPGMTGIEGVKQIRQQSKDVKILMLTVFDDNQNVFAAIRNGANGYLLKKTPPAKLISYIREAYEGGAPMNAAIATQVLKMFAAMHPPAQSNYDLSEREKQILHSLVEGNSYKMVAAELKISIDTVRSHIRNIYEKMHVNSKSEAVAKALRDRLV
jgi:DNA-binding NarL/FixJ family response regulator